MRAECSPKADKLQPVILRRTVCKTHGQPLNVCTGGRSEG